MKPAVGFILPSAGVTPAPSTNRKMARTPFCSQVLFPVSFRPCVIQSEAKNPGSFLVRGVQQLLQITRVASLTRGLPSSVIEHLAGRIDDCNRRDVAVVVAS